MEKVTKKIWIKIALIILLISLVFGLTFYLKGNKKSERHFAIIPHFMLNSEKVDQFYNFLSNEYYPDNKPDTIVLISPNHFYTDEKEIKTICENSQVNYKSETVNLSAKLHGLWMKCDDKKEIFSSRWDSIQTNEHGIWGHFQWINKYFPDSEIIPIISPCFQLSAVKDILSTVENLDWNILVIASVDFAHYQNEEQTLQHDQKSIETLKSMTLNESEFMESIDVDCPACLYLIQSLANQKWQEPELWYRDSSSTILWKDMWEENTSRVFMRYN